MELAGGGRREQAGQLGLGHPQQRCHGFDLDAQLGGDPGRVGPGAVQANSRSVYLGKLVQGRGQVHGSTLSRDGADVGSSALLDSGPAGYPAWPVRLPGRAGGVRRAHTEDYSPARARLPRAP